ncbi:MAG: hypothetical protein MI749_09780 [Desulfovibrionales bacterium]|nr:hypothetical protein [Desulfovibrionales bacterium]
MTTATGISAGQASAIDSGYFVVDGQKITFQDLVVMMGLLSLEAQDKTFESMFNEAQERTEFMNKLNDMIQMCNKYKENKDGGTFSAEDMNLWKTVYYPKMVESGLVKDSGIGIDGSFSQEEIKTFCENATLAQTNMSSTNEQQMIRTNQAANKRGTILQQVQTLLSTVKEGNSSAAR